MPVIINGEVENGLSAVISIGTDALGDPISFCTASVIAPRVVLTAAHCTEFIPVELLTIAGRAFFGTDINAPTHTLNFEAVYLHPAYVELANGGEQLPEYDLSVLILAEDAPVQPMWWRTEAVTDADVGSPLLSVGFGLDERNRSGVKRSAPLQLDGYDEQFVIVRNASNAAGANICSGDSGGPQLIWDEQVDDWRQLAVHSWGRHRLRPAVRQHPHRHRRGLGARDRASHPWDGRPVHALGLPHQWLVRRLLWCAGDGRSRVCVGRHRWAAGAGRRAEDHVQQRLQRHGPCGATHAPDGRCTAPGVPQCRPNLTCPRAAPRPAMG